MGGWRRRVYGQGIIDESVRDVNTCTSPTPICALFYSWRSWNCGHGCNGSTTHEGSNKIKLSAFAVEPYFIFSGATKHFHLAKHKYNGPGTGSNSDSSGKPDHPSLPSSPSSPSSPSFHSSSSSYSSSY